MVIRRAWFARRNQAGFGRVPDSMFSCALAAVSNPTMPDYRCPDSALLA
jgi:hypothetical protein